jgi:hypothetical protein
MKMGDSFRTARLNLRELLTNVKSWRWREKVAVTQCRRALEIRH